MIDGGPSGVYARSLKPRLDQLKQQRSPDEPLPIRMVMVSHIDDDHISFANLVMVPAGQKSRKFDAGDGLLLTVIGPDEERVRALQEEWDRQIDKLGVAKVAEFADQSVFNLSSITVLATFKKKTRLLTGDARGDIVLAGLRRAKLLKNGKLHVDLLKMPHHGSDNNVDTDFFRSIIADHYVVSGDGEHGNPEVSTFQMISDARGQDEFTIHLTHGRLPEDPDPNKLLDFFRKEKKAGKQYKTAIREPDALGIAVDLLA